MNLTDDKQTKIATSAKAVAASQNPKRPDNWRETIESIVVAFVLAFLFRTFEAEAFVIPTGSMAPTLYGQQRDVVCTKCKTRFAVGVSSVPANDAEIRDGRLVPAYRSNFAVCPNANCRFPNNVLDHEMFAGDRILVNKFPYEFGDPQRWDVVVFKFPEQAKTNYIKRLAGLPGEELLIENGDVKVRPLDSDAPFFIARKHPDKQRQLQLPVHDNDHPASDLLKAGWPESWANQGTEAWVAHVGSRSFQIDGEKLDSEQQHWLRYTNYTPTAEDWMTALSGKDEHLARRAKPQLIKDFYAYNGRISVSEAENRVARGELPELIVNEPEQWVGDLTLHATVDLLAPRGELTLELIKGLRRHHCRIDLQSGSAIFAYSHEDDRGEGALKDVKKPFDTGMNKPGTYKVSFTDVDDRLCLWVDDRLVEFFEFDPDDGNPDPPQNSSIAGTALDKAPAGIAARAASLKVSHLRIERDIYYRSDFAGSHSSSKKTFRLKDDPDDRNDEFMMLGDNSPRSNDSRLWQTTHAVPRHLLIGKAFLIYWPHGVPFLNNGHGYAVGQYFEPLPRDGSEPNPPLPKFSIPFYPQVGRMHRIR